MGRMVEGIRTGRRSGHALRVSASLSAGLLLAVAAWAPAQGPGDGPELLPPSNMPATPKPAEPARPRPATTPAPAPRGNRAVLALPGITTPTGRAPGVIVSTPMGSPAPSATTAPAPSVDSLPAPGELMLDGPIEMPDAPRANRPAPGAAYGRPGRPMSLDPLPMDEGPLPGDSPSRSNPANKRSTTITPRPDPAPMRRGRFFGLGPGPGGTPLVPRSAMPGRTVVEDKDRVEDPAVESALKRRIEKQARDAVGDRVRSLEVRVVDKNVAIDARGVRFYQKRAVRKSLESLPALSGLRSTIDVRD